MTWRNLVVKNKVRAMQNANVFELIIDINTVVLSLLTKRLNASKEQLKTSLRQLADQAVAEKECVDKTELNVTNEERLELLSAFDKVLQLFLLDNGAWMESASSSLSMFYRVLSMYKGVVFPPMNSSTKIKFEKVEELLGTKENSANELNKLNEICSFFSED